MSSSTRSAIARRNFRFAGFALAVGLTIGSANAVSSRSLAMNNPAAMLVMTITPELK